MPVGWRHAIQPRQLKKEIHTALFFPGSSIISLARFSTEANCIPKDMEYNELAWPMVGWTISRELLLNS